MSNFTACHPFEFNLKYNVLFQDEPHKVKEGKPAPAPPQGFLSEVFAGQLSSTVTCQTCHHQSTTLEPFMDLSLPIPQDTLAQLESFDRYHTPTKKTEHALCRMHRLCI